MSCFPKFRKILITVFLLGMAACATTHHGNDGGEEALLGLFCEEGGSFSLPAALPASFNGMVFNPVGDALEFGLIDLEFLSGQGGEALVIAQNGHVYYLRADFTALATMVVIPVETGGEQGLLNVAADPNYAVNNAVYFYRTTPGGLSNQVVRYTLQNLDLGAPGDFELNDMQVIAEFPKDENPQFGSNHNGGGMVFDTVGNLLIGVGDGGGAGSADQTLAISQNPALSLGKIHRIVPRATGNTNGGGEGQGYDLPVAPADDLNLANPDGPDSIYMSGLRNPFSLVNKEQNDQLVGDVGSGIFEEINCLYHAGENFGWPFFEGPEGAPQGFEPAAWGYCHNDNSFALEDPLATDSGARSIMVLAFIEGPTAYGNLLDRRAIYAEFYQGWVRALRVEENHVKSADDPIGHLEGFTSLQRHPSDGFYYGISLTTSDRVLRMEETP